jgi:hypothetical protein
MEVLRSDGDIEVVNSLLRAWQSCSFSENLTESVYFDLRGGRL